MDIVNDLLLWVHFVALAMGGAATFGLPVIGSRMAAATPETRQTLFGIIKGISTISRAALVILIVTGLAMIWTRWGGDLSGPGIWFHIKMALVVVLLAGVVFSGINLKRAMGGDAAAARRQPQLGAIMLVVLLAVVLAAVFAFH